MTEQTQTQTQPPSPQPKPHAKQHKLALAGSIIAALAVIPAWWHVPLGLALAADLATTIHAPDAALILALAVALAAYHLITSNRETYAVGEIAALLIALAAAYLLYTDLRHIMSAYDTLGGPGVLIEPPNVIYAIAGIIGTLAAAGASAAALIDIASDHA